MTKQLTILEKGRQDEIDVLSPLEMNNILGGSGPTCTHGYCLQTYSQRPDGTIICGCGYVHPIVPIDPDPPHKIG